MFLWRPWFATTFCCNHLLVSFDSFYANVCERKTLFATFYISLYFGGTKFNGEEAVCVNEPHFYKSDKYRICADSCGKKLVNLLYSLSWDGNFFVFFNTTSQKTFQLIIEKQKCHWTLKTSSPSTKCRYNFWLLMLSNVRWWQFNQFRISMQLLYDLLLISSYYFHFITQTYQSPTELQVIALCLSKIDSTASIQKDILNR